MAHLLLAEKGTELIEVAPQILPQMFNTSFFHINMLHLWMDLIN